MLFWRFTMRDCLLRLIFYTEQILREKPSKMYSTLTALTRDMLLCRFTLRDCHLRQIFYTEHIPKPTFTANKFFSSILTALTLWRDMLFWRFTLRDCPLRLIFYTEQILKKKLLSQLPSKMFSILTALTRDMLFWRFTLRDWRLPRTLSLPLSLSLLSFSFLIMMLKGFANDCDMRTANDHKKCPLFVFFLFPAKPSPISTDRLIKVANNNHEKLQQRYILMMIPWWRCSTVNSVFNHHPWHTTSNA